jgi:hypothetical protein
MNGPWTRNVANKESAEVSHEFTMCTLYLAILPVSVWSDRMYTAAQQFQQLRDYRANERLEVITSHAGQPMVSTEHSIETLRHALCISRGEGKQLKSSREGIYYH